MKLIACIFFVFFLLLSCSNKGGNLSPDCEIDSGPCTKNNISLDVEPKPVKAMKSLNFRVKLANYGDIKSVVIDLAMPNMPMGYNQVTLEKTGFDIYEGRGIIPFCPSGKKLWRASVVVNNKTEGTFLFDVHY